MHRAIDERATDPQKALARPLPRGARRFARGARPAALAASLFVTVSTARADPPTNDHYTNATLVDPLPFMDLVNTTEAQKDPEVFGPCFTLVHTVWYELTAEQTGRYLITTAGSDFEAGIEAYAPLDGVPTFFTDCASGVDATIVLDLTAGQTFFVQAGTLHPDEPGDLQIRVELLPEFAAELELDPDGTVNGMTGIATVTGTLQCTRPTTGQVCVTLKQKVKGGQQSLQGDACDEEVSCPGEFSLSVSPQSGFFKGGKVVVMASLFVCSFGDCVQENLEAQVVQLSNQSKQ